MQSPDSGRHLEQIRNWTDPQTNVSFKSKHVIKIPMYKPVLGAQRVTTYQTPMQTMHTQRSQCTYRREHPISSALRSLDTEESQLESPQTKRRRFSCLENKEQMLLRVGYNQHRQPNLEPRKLSRHVKPLPPQAVRVKSLV